MKKGLLFVLALLLLSFASADLYVTQNNAVYSKGDMLNLSVGVSSIKTASDFLKLEIICNNNSVEVYKVPLTLKQGEQRNINVQVSLERSVIDNLKGTCNVKASYDGQESRTNSFEISSDVLMASNIAGTYNPGESINASGSAIKKNGYNLEGSIEVSGELTTSFVQPVQNGKFSFSFSIPEHAQAKAYSINLRAYDEDYKGNIGNSGTASATVIVRQVLNSLDVALSESNIEPGKNLSYSIVALDQAGDYMKVNSEVTISSPLGESSSINLSSSETREITTISSTTPGKWIILAKRGNLNVSKVFNVEELKRISYKLEGNSLIIVNTGNVLYSDAVMIKVGNESILKNVTLGVGNQQNYTLSAPDGDYEIGIVGQNSTESLGSVFLTGKVVAVTGPDEEATKFGSWLWVILILIIGAGVWYYYSKVSGNKWDTKSESTTSNFKASKMGSLTHVKVDAIDNGKRERAAVMILKVRNAHKLAGNQLFGSVISKISDKARGYKAHVSRTSDTMTIVFSPTLMGSSDLALAAAETSRYAAEHLDQYNKKFNSPADYGIGVNEGEIVIEYRGGTFKYMSVSNTIALARKLAENAKKEALISTAVHSLTRAKVKVERAVEGWRVTELKDNSQYSDFISKFKQRQSRGDW